MGRVVTLNIAIVAAAFLSSLSQAAFHGVRQQPTDSTTTLLSGEAPTIVQGDPRWLTVPAQDDDCNAFRDFNYSIDPFRHNRTAVLVLDLRRRLDEVSVRLLSSDCNFSCLEWEHTNVSCNTSSQNATTPTRVLPRGKHSVKQKYTFHNIAGKYFCLTISLDSCGLLSTVRTTETCKFEDVGNSTQRPVALPDGSLPVTAIAVAMTLAAALLLAGAAYCIKARLFTPRPWLGALQDGSATATAAPLLAAPPAILLLYSRDSEGFVRLMEAFRNLLAVLTGVEVLDPLDMRQRMAEVFPDPVSWLTRQLRRPDVKVVLVVSAGALARQRALLLGQRPTRATAAAPHSLEELFTHALRIMQDDHQIGGNYRRVYKVRFEDITRTTETLSLIVPMRDYHLMRHTGRLIHELRGERVPPDADDITHSQELLWNLPEADSLLAILKELSV